MSADTPNPLYIEPAFPGQYDHGQGQIESWVGMNLRDYFAAKAMGLKLRASGPSLSYQEFAEACYELADAMLAARGGEK